MFMIIDLYKRKWIHLLGRLIVLAILLYEQLTNLKQINLCPNMQLFEQSAACLSVIFMLVPVRSGFDSVCINVAR